MGDARGRTPTVFAAQQGLDDVMAELLKTAKDIEATDNTQVTPLHWATRGGHATMVRQLLDAGANRHKTDGWGGTAHKAADEHPHLHTHFGISKTATATSAKVPAMAASISSSATASAMAASISSSATAS